MIYRIKPSQDTSISQTSKEEIASFGGDEVLELGKCSREGSEGSSRILITVPVNLLTLDGSSNQATLHLTCASAKNLPDQFTIRVYRIEENWTEGTGHVVDDPGNSYGATWYLPDGIDSEDEWEGGIREEHELEVFCEQSFARGDCLDLNIDLISFLGPVPFPRPGSTRLLIAFEDEVLAESLGSQICYFSRETHTIYPPYLEVRSNSDYHSDASESLDSLNGVVVGTRNLKSYYYDSEVVRIDLSVKPEFPERVFSTSSLYRDLDKGLPQGTTWGIRDEYTGKMVVDFGQGTLISYDSGSNFIGLDTSLLEPERYYRILVQGNSTESGNMRILDTRGIFRVVRNGKA